MFGIGLFIIAFLIHLVAWRFHIPRNHTKVLLAIFLIIWVIGVLVGLAIHYDLLEILQFCVLYFSIVLAYITTYSALEVDSPSLVMVMAIAKSAHKGLDKDVFNKEMNDNILVAPRIKDLVTAGLVYANGDVYKITPQGKFLVNIFIFYRRLMRRPEKGG